LVNEFKALLFHPYSLNPHAPTFCTPENSKNTAPIKVKGIVILVSIILLSLQAKMK
jgi:hypothetical protein